MLQFPLSFEFNDHFLSTIAYHHVSMRFRTFLLDSEHERSESGWMAEEDHKPRGKSLWDYMDLQKSKSPLYNNFLFSPNQHKVCKVMNNIFFQGGVELPLLGVQSWCWSCKHLIPDVQCKQTLYLSIHFPWSSHFPQVGIFPECTAAPLNMRTHCKRTSSVKKHLT